ncbi:hypothetical protein HQO38_11140 [Rhodococcus fascians]|uniref:DUF3093 domain-containing protein n=2 Tax=root TaxID=1 RepID=A0A143QH88_RHOFA|nr:MULTISPECIES: hypothetical protein [Rhodococcus]MSX06766.1 hypothetical protein [Actinomycetota bacterium]AMY21862.1 hypothetical protein A3Q41_00542 [Rhodococcus fascians]AMY54155.1 hypothetical protein A3L23_02818 [Rhodococcus fascians D188]KMJ51301.1 membrane protein [Rhodococcus fascians]KQU37366.1 hypothetical protein ASH04_03510 [Rhodococcus sp. Leaf233]
MSNDLGGTDPVLFHEPGGRWRALLWGPAFCLVVLAVELASGPVIHWFALALFSLILVGLTYVQLRAARMHVSVELTTRQLRQGTETVDVAEITEIFPPAEYEDGEYEPKKWETARVLGELSGVPRKRHGIGLRLVGGGLVQAWAKDDDGLRAALETAKQEYV